MNNLINQELTGNKSLNICKNSLKKDKKKSQREGQNEWEIYCE